MNIDLLHQMDNRFFKETIGIVRATNDPTEQGRLKIYCPAIDKEEYAVADLPWAWYEMQFGGSIAGMYRGAPPPGETVGTPSAGGVAYGFWNIPKVGAQVIVKFMGGDPNYRIWSGVLMPMHTNRSLPGGRNLHMDTGDKGPWTDTYAPLEPYYSNVRLAGGDSEDWWWNTRGGYERQVAEAATTKTTEEGYSENASKDGSGETDPQTYSWTSPGGHMITMQDHPSFCRMRLRTVGGHQIILDDTNERIYLSTAKGSFWMEIDQDGHMHVHAEESISFNTERDFNINAEGIVNINGEKGVKIRTPQTVKVNADEDIRMNAEKDMYHTTPGSVHMDIGKDMLITTGKDFHLKSGGSVYESAASNVHVTGGGSVFATASSAMHLNGGGQIVQTGGSIHLNGPSATKATKANKAEKAFTSPNSVMPKDVVNVRPYETHTEKPEEFNEKPVIIPKHEPWDERPVVHEPTNHGPRNGLWTK